MLTENKKVVLKLKPQHKESAHSCHKKKLRQSKILLLHKLTVKNIIWFLMCNKINTIHTLDAIGMFWKYGNSIKHMRAHSITHEFTVHTYDSMIIARMAIIQKRSYTEYVLDNVYSNHTVVTELNSRVNVRLQKHHLK